METVYIEGVSGEDAGMKNQKEGRVPGSEGPRRSNEEGNTGIRECGRSDGSEDETNNSKNSNSSMMLGLLEEFTKIYSDRLQRVEDAAMKKDGKEYLESKVSVLESWVRDLGEQNAVLVATVEELEREAAERVALLEERLSTMAATTRQSCVSLRDHQIQVSSLVTDKISLEKGTKALEEKIQLLEDNNARLTEENTGLHSDIDSLVQVINRARGTGQWEANDLTFSVISPEQLFGPVLSTSRQSSPPIKENQQEFFHVIEEPVKKDNSSAASSYSNLQDMESSTYGGGQSSEKALLILKLRTDLQSVQSLHEEATTQLLERDKQIADLQSQLTEMKARMSGSQTSKTTNSLSFTLHDKRKGGNSVEGEMQVSESSDVVVSRLAEVEGECHQLQQQHRVLQECHSLCTPTINRLREQISISHKTQEELRTVLTAEVAQRHDQIVDLHDELKEQEQKQHETQMQLQLKNEIIKDLRKEIKSLKHCSEGLEKDDVTPVKDINRASRENKCAETQTNEAQNANWITSEQLSRTSLSGSYTNTSQSLQISKLQNELAEKNILLRELQSHLSASRQELHLKDETLFKLEQKLDSSRRDGGEKGERMQYLTSQLTNLQLDVGKSHGQLEQMKRQVENKNDLIHKLETENSSLTRQLNDKSATLERLQTEMIKASTDLDNKKKEASEQRLTINALQEALVSSKRSCDQLRSRLSSDVSSSMMHSPQQTIHNTSNNNPVFASTTTTASVSECIATNPMSTKHQRVTSSTDACPTTTTAAIMSECIATNPLNMQHQRVSTSTDACLTTAATIGVTCNSPTTVPNALPVFARNVNTESNNCDTSSPLSPTTAAAIGVPCNSATTLADELPALPIARQVSSESSNCNTISESHHTISQLVTTDATGVPFNSVTFLTDSKHISSESSSCDTSSAIHTTNSESVAATTASIPFNSIAVFADSRNVSSQSNSCDSSSESHCTNSSVTPQSASVREFHNASTCDTKPLPRHNHCTNSSVTAQSVNVRELYSNTCDTKSSPLHSVKDATTQTSLCTSTPDVLSSCSGSNNFLMTSSSDGNPCVNSVHLTNTDFNTIVSVSDGINTECETSDVKKAGMVYNI